MVANLKKRVGLFGGSFNPAHEGHVYISEMALLKLNLQEIWWLVAPRNPAKEKHTLASYDVRLKGAREMAAGKTIKVRDIEQKNRLFYTIDTLKYLKSHFPDLAFAWIMGADCFAGLHTWKSWKKIMALIPLAVFPRPGFSEEALNGQAAKVFAKNRLAGEEAQNLVVTTPPAWVYIEIKPLSISGTKIRRGAKG